MIDVKKVINAKIIAVLPELYNRIKNIKGKTLPFIVTVIPGHISKCNIMKGVKLFHCEFTLLVHHSSVTALELLSGKIISSLCGEWDEDFQCVFQSGKCVYYPDKGYHVCQLKFKLLKEDTTWTGLKDEDED